MDDLLRALKARDIALTRDDVQWAFDSPQTKDEITAWVREYLKPATLLSKDEVKLHENLRRQGIQPLTPGSHAVNEDDLLSAIESLESSTAAIEKHQKVLEGQKSALQQLIGRNFSHESVETERDEHPGLPDAHESSRLKVAVEETVESINEDVSTTSDMVTSTVRSLATYASERLSSDDQTLEAISKLDLQNSQGPQMTDTKIIEQWCRSLVSFRTAEVKARIESIYNSAVTEASEGAVDTSLDSNSQQEKDALQSELQTLREEIASVAEMVVENELRKPVVTFIERSASERVRAQREWLDYVLSSFRYIIGRLDCLEACASDLNVFHSALREINEALESSQSENISDAVATPTTSHKTRHTSAYSEVIRAGRKGSATLDDDDILRLLRNLDIDIPSKTNSTAHAIVANSLASRSTRLQTQFTAAELSTLQTLGEYLEHQDANAQSALSTLYANTAYWTKSLSNPLLGAEIASLEAAMNGVGTSISKIEGNQGDVEPVGLKIMRRKWNR
ncbi:hypothetical protein NA57DRAFT_76030 [Rhizodiscina lignyota]|uniref:HAUS augmin-like complex subunit 3 N-terminal domain-containing protein n=1 Tax=Rhizodiscina lignyota TaxID=1504668 RepID=A0A9P4IIH0_9PEZI|nr:hypothetical protein NA57DRAFT_76030 [Rhizodiscina lignyota]